MSKMYNQYKNRRSMSPIRKCMSRESSPSSISSNESFTSFHNFSSSSRFSTQHPNISKLYKNRLSLNQDDADYAQILNPGHEYLVRDLPLSLFRRYNHSHEYLNKKDKSLPGASYFPQFNYTNLGQYDSEGKRIRRSLTPIPFESRRSQDFNPIPLTKSLSVQISPYKDSMRDSNSLKEFRIGYNDDPKPEYRSLASRVFSKYLDGKSRPNIKNVEKGIDKCESQASLDDSSDFLCPDKHEKRRSESDIPKHVNSSKTKIKNLALEDDFDNEELYYSMPYYKNDNSSINEDEINKDKLGIFRKILNYDDIQGKLEDDANNGNKKVSDIKVTVSKDKISGIISNKESDIMKEPSEKQVPNIISPNQKLFDTEYNEQKNKLVEQTDADINKRDINFYTQIQANMLEDMPENIDKSKKISDIDAYIKKDNESEYLKLISKELIKDENQINTQLKTHKIEELSEKPEKIYDEVNLKTVGEKDENLLFLKDKDLNKFDKNIDSHINDKIEDMPLKMAVISDIFSPDELKMNTDKKLENSSKSIDDFNKNVDNNVKIEKVEKLSEIPNSDIFKTENEFKFNEKVETKDNLLMLKTDLNKIDKKADTILETDKVDMSDKFWADINVEVLDIYEDNSVLDVETKKNDSNKDIQKDISEIKRSPDKPLPIVNTKQNEYNLVQNKKQEESSDTFQLNKSKNVSNPSEDQLFNQLSDNNNNFNVKVSKETIITNNNNEQAQAERVKKFYDQFIDQDFYLNKDLELHIPDKFIDTFNGSDNLTLIIDNESSENEQLDSEKTLDKTQEKCQSRGEGTQSDTSKKYQDKSSFESLNLLKSNSLSEDKEPEDNKNDNEQATSVTECLIEETKSFKMIRQGPSKESMKTIMLNKTVSEGSEDSQGWFNCIGSCWCEQGTEEEEAMLPSENVGKRSFHRKILNFSMLGIILVLIFTIIIYEWTANKNDVPKSTNNICDCLLSDKDIC